MNSKLNVIKIKCVKSYFRAKQLNLIQIFVIVCMKCFECSLNSKQTLDNDLKMGESIKNNQLTR